MAESSCPPHATHSLPPSLRHSLCPSFIPPSFIHSLPPSFIHSLIDPIIQPLPPSFIHSLIPSLIGSPTDSFIHSLTHSTTPCLPHSPPPCSTHTAPVLGLRALRPWPCWRKAATGPWHGQPDSGAGRRTQGCEGAESGKAWRGHLNGAESVGKGVEATGASRRGWPREHPGSAWRRAPTLCCAPMGPGARPTTASPGRQRRRGPSSRPAPAESLSSGSARPHAAAPPGSPR